MDEPNLFERATAILKTAWEHPDWFIFGITAVLGLGGAAWRWLLPRLRAPAPPLSSDPSFPFEVIKPRSEGALKILMGSDQANDDPLADFNIPYQQRRPELIVQEQLEGLLDVHRWLLILGPTGLGKTREAAELANRLNSEGWTVLKLKNHEQLAVPTQFPAEVIGEQLKLLFFLDNLNQAMNLDLEASREPKGNLSTTLKQPLQERLQETLEFFERSCGANRIRVIATARNETLSEKLGQLSEWDKLAIETYPKFWVQFCQYLLQVPIETAIETVLAQTTIQASLPANSRDFSTIAHRNDGTFRNVVENLERAKNRRLTISTATYKDTLRGTWQSRYQAAVDSDKTAKYVYDAVDLLRQCNVELLNITVLPIAALLASKNQPWRFWYRHKIGQSLQHLDHIERILQPRDGQIEAKGYAIEIKKTIDEVGELLINLSKQNPKKLENTLMGFAGTAAGLEQYGMAMKVNSRLAKIRPRSDVIWCNQGWLEDKIGQKELAVTSYNRALEINPNSYKAYAGRGCAYMPNRWDLALNDFERALEFQPSDPLLTQLSFARHAILFQIGSENQKQLAIEGMNFALENPTFFESFTQALAKDPTFFESFTQALAKDPHWHQAILKAWHDQDSSNLPPL